MPNISQSFKIAQTQSMNQNIRLSQAQIQSLNLLKMSVVDLKEQINFLVKSNPFLEIDYNSSSNSDFNGIISNYNQDKKYLKDILKEQIHLSDLSDKEIEIGEEILTGIDESGFWIKDEESGLFFIDDYCNDFVNNNRGSKDLIENIVSKLQHLEPLGCFSFNQLESAFIIASVHKDAPDEVFSVLEKVYNFIKKAPYADFQNFLIELCKGDNFLTNEIAEYLSKKNIVPGKNFDSRNYQKLVDMAIFVKDDNSVEIKINKDYPSIKLSEENISLKTQTLAKDEKKYFNDNINYAKQSIEYIKYRENTLEKLALFIGNEQKEFIKKGKRYLKPLLQKDVAAYLDVSESTISRLANDKLIHINGGVVKLKEFFSTSIKGNSISKTALKEEIKIILKETKVKISDREIAEILNKRGINISRRTVNKYRLEITV